MYTQDIKNATLNFFLNNFFNFYAPNFEEVEEAYWFGPCVHAWVTLCIRSRTVRDRILKFDMCNKYGK